MSSTGPRIEITVRKNGETSTEVFGVPGGNCHLVSGPYEKLLGDIMSTTAKTDAYEDPELVEIKGEIHN